MAGTTINLLSLLTYLLTYARIFCFYFVVCCARAQFDNHESHRVRSDSVRGDIRACMRKCRLTG